MKQNSKAGSSVVVPSFLCSRVVNQTEYFFRDRVCVWARVSVEVGAGCTYMLMHGGWGLGIILFAQKAIHLSFPRQYLLLGSGALPVKLGCLTSKH